MCVCVCSRGSQKPQQQGDGAVAGSSQDDEQPGPSRRKRQPSMSESMPLYTLCKEDLDSMDREVGLRGHLPKHVSMSSWGPEGVTNSNAVVTLRSIDERPKLWIVLLTIH